MTMVRMRISGLFCAVVSSLLLMVPMAAEASKYRIEPPMPPARFFNGFGVGVDGVGFGMLAAGARFANAEIMGRANLKERFFPIVELGIGQCDRSGREQATTFHTRSPYFRAGGDYCITGKRNGNRFLVGGRYGVAKFKYDLANPDFHDEVYGGDYPLDFRGLKGKSHWLEICVGCETKIWRFVRLGWTMRYKARLGKKFSEHGDPWYTPGFGKSGGSTFGGTVNLVFDFDRLTFMKKRGSSPLPLP